MNVERQGGNVWGVALLLVEQQKTKKKVRGRELRRESS